MDLYITEKDTGKQIALSLLPDEVKTKATTNTISYSFIERGEVKLPNGQKLNQYSWSGTFPGKSRLGLPFIKSQHWAAPKELISTIETWRQNGTKLTLMLTETTLNATVYLSAFTHTWAGGSGDAEYDITFIEAKDVKVKTVTEAKTTTTSSRPASQTTDTNKSAEQTRTYTVVSGDNLWNIAKKYLGSGSRYTEIYELNKSIIGSDPNLILVGQTFVLPAA